MASLLSVGNVLSETMLTTFRAVVIPATTLLARTTNLLNRFSAWPRVRLASPNDNK